MSDAAVRRIGGAIAVAVGAVLLCGCAQPSFTHDLERQIHGAGVRNAGTQRVADMPWLRVNTYLTDRLKHVANANELEPARADLLAVIEGSAALALRDTRAEIDCLPSEAAARIGQRWLNENAVPKDLRGAIAEEFANAQRHEVDILMADVQRAATTDALRRRARTILRNVQRSPKDRHGEGFILQLVSRSIEEPPGPDEIRDQPIDLYAPSLAMPVRDSNLRLRSDDEQLLLQKYAPIIAQERIVGAPYDPTFDQVGEVRLDGTTQQPRIVVEAANPVVYAYTTQAIIGGRHHLQLVYTYWFPEHPPRASSADPGCGCSGAKPSKDDPEAGRIDGATLRITLDSLSHPAIFETMLNCGCHHRCWLSQAVEEAAKEAFVSPEHGKRFATERDVPGKMDLIIPAVVSAETDARPILFSRAGTHSIGNLYFSEKLESSASIASRRNYVVRSYDDLECLPLGHGHSSMFLPNGLVRGAERREGSLLAITGMLSAGQPRQRGTQRIRWDVYDFDDPRLLDECLRLPPGF